MGLPPGVVVVNDAGLTLIRRVQDRDFAGRRCEVDLVNPDFVALAAAYGIPAERVDTPDSLRQAVSRAVDRGHGHEARVAKRPYSFGALCLHLLITSQ